MIAYVGYIETRRKEMDANITIIPCVLSDGSKVYNVGLDKNGGYIEFACIDKKAADEMAFSLGQAIRKFTNDTAIIEEGTTREYA
jgi:hypothetical protein